MGTRGAAWQDMAPPCCWLSRRHDLPGIPRAEQSHPKGGHCIFRLDNVTSLTMAMSAPKMTLDHLHQSCLGGIQMSPTCAGLLHGGPTAKPPPIPALPGEDEVLHNSGCNNLTLGSGHGGDVDTHLPRHAVLQATTCCPRVASLIACRDVLLQPQPGCLPLHLGDAQPKHLKH